MHDSDSFIKAILQIVFGIILVTLFIFVWVIQKGASQETHSVITSLFLH